MAKWKAGTALRPHLLRLALWLNACLALSAQPAGRREADGKRSEEGWGEQGVRLTLAATCVLLLSRRACGRTLREKLVEDILIIPCEAGPGCGGIQSPRLHRPPHVKSSVCCDEPAGSFYLRGVCRSNIRSLDRPFCGVVLEEKLPEASIERARGNFQKEPRPHRCRGGSISQA
jgi:hypothetical protein